MSKKDQKKEKAKPKIRKTDTKRTTDKWKKKKMVYNFCAKTV